MAKRKLALTLIFALFFALFSRDITSSVETYYGKEAARFVSSANGALINSNAAAVTFKTVVIGKSYVKTRYMGGDCFEICSFSFRPLVGLFSNPQKIIRANCFISPQSRFLFSLRGPPSNSIRLI